MYTRNRMLAVSLILLAACGDDVSGIEDGGPADAGMVPLTVDGMVASACVRDTCQASLIVRYWKDEWDTYAVQRTVRFVEVSGTEQRLDITDEAGAPATLDFEVGRPVTLTVINPGDGASGAHFLTAPGFYRSVAWRKVETLDAEYKAPHFDAFAVLHQAGSDRQIELYFVPMRVGTFSAYCEDGVTNGAAYAGIVAETATADLSTGHAGLGMTAMVQVTGAIAGTLEPEVYPGRDPALDADPRRDVSDPVWADGARDETHRAAPIQIVEISETEFAYQPANLDLTTGVGYVIAFQVPATNMGKHYYTAPDFFVRSVLRKAADSHAEIHASYLTAIEILVGGTSEVWVVPVGVGRFVPYCQIGVRTAIDGWPVLTTGHASRGMVGRITVREPP